MIIIAGAGLAGLACAVELARGGAQVRVFDTAPGPGERSVARFAGGMLAPWCEGETADPQVTALGSAAANWWERITPVVRRGTLVLAAPRDSAEIRRFARRTQAHRQLDADEIARLEPALAGRFGQGLFFAQEAHLDPRRALADLAGAARKLGVELHWAAPAPGPVDLDCTGIHAELPGLRPVRGEMAILHCPDVAISRTLRLLHPRMPLYLVPRGDGRYMIGATMIESGSDRAPSLRSLAEMLGAAFALHPGFGEAAVVETGAGLRPAFADNLPRLIRRGGTLYLNGLYRHGFLLAPAMAARAAQHLIPEICDANYRQRSDA